MSDLISRAAAIDAVHEEFDECLVWDESGRYTADEVERILDRVPSVQPRKGKWIYGESEIGNDGYYCSVCGNFVPWKYDEYDIDFIKEFLFCPNCGCRMEEGDSDDR